MPTPQENAPPTPTPPEITPPAPTSQETVPSAPPASQETVTVTFELEVECEPPAGTAFFGFIPAEGGMRAQLADPDGDGLYTGSMDVDRFGPGPRRVPPGAEPATLGPILIVEGTDREISRVIEDFGQAKIDEDKTFTASDNSFCGDGGGSDNDGGGSDGGGSGNDASSDGGFLGGLLPETGGGWAALLLIAGAVLVGGGWLLVRRFSAG